jgi:hypothetical protein
MWWFMTRGQRRYRLAPLARCWNMRASAATVAEAAGYLATADPVGAGGQAVLRLAAILHFLPPGGGPGW